MTTDGHPMHAICMLSVYAFETKWTDIQDIIMRRSSGN